MPHLLPRYFPWHVSASNGLSTPISLEISINFREFDNAAAASNCRIDSVRELAMDAIRFILTTPKYASFLNSCEGLPVTPNNAIYMTQYLTFIGKDVANHHSHISEQDSINYFFGIAPIPDEKILMMM